MVDLYQNSNKIEALHGGMVRSYLPYDIRSRLTVLQIFDCLTSTNDYLLDSITNYNNGFHLCFADSQTQGKGRRGGRQWLSPHCGSIYMSVMHRCPDAFLAWLGLVVAMEVAAGFKALGGKSIGVKWPNDIYCPHGKVGGVLVENKRNVCVVGIGINLHLPHNFPLLPSAPAALEQALPVIISRNMLAAIMAETVIKAFDSLAATADTSQLISRFREFDILYDKRVQVQGNGTPPLSGVASGLTSAAELRVQHTHGIKVYRSARVSINL